MKLYEVTGYRSRTATILKESYQDLTETQVIYLNRWEKELWPLMEQYVAEASAQLTPDQIQDIFKGAEGVADASGANKNTLGKAAGAVGAAAKLPVEIAKKVDAKIVELGKLAQNAGPVKNADQKFEQLKKDIMSNNSDSKIVQGIVKVSDWAKANPGKASIAVGILTAIAAFAGGPMGGAAAGLILRSTNELLKGEKLSTAIGKSVKTAAYGAIAGWALDGIGDWLEGLRMDVVPYDKAPGLTSIEVGFKDTLSGPGIKDIREFGSMIVPEDRVGEFTDLLNVMKDATAQTGSTTDPAALDAFDQLWNFAKTFDKKEFIDNMNLQNSVAKAIAVANDEFLQNLTNANDAIAAIAQGSIQSQGEKGAFKVGGDEVKPGDVVTSAAGNKKIAGVDGKATAVDPSDLKGRVDIANAAGESFDYTNDMAVLYDEWLREAPKLSNPGGLGAKIKSGIGKAAGAVGGAVKKGAKELTSNVTAAKLNSQWKKMGEPTDAGSIYNLLKSFGMDDAMVQQIATGAKVELKPTDGKDAGADSKAVKGATGQEPTGDKGGVPGQAGANTGGDAGSQQAGGDAGGTAGGSGAKLVPSTVKAGTVQEIDGVKYEFEGDLWKNLSTGKPIGKIPSLKLGLPHPKISPLVDLAKKDPKLAKLIKAQITSKGIEAGTSAAAKAAKAGVKGTEKLDAKGVTKAAPGTVGTTPAPKKAAAKKTPNPKAPVKKKKPVVKKPKK